MEVGIEQADGFSLYIDYRKSEGEPSRVFHAMGELIDNFAELDQQLIGIIAEPVGTELVLDDVEAGSLRSKLRNLILEIPDEALGKLEYKEIVGHFLVKAKYLVANWLSENKQVTSLEQVQDLQRQLIATAEETGIKQLPVYAPIDTRRLLSCINSIDQSISYLDSRDVVRYESPYGNVEIPHAAHLSDTIIQEILTKEVLISDDIRIVKVKKPDYLGRSQWVLKYAGHNINASIDHTGWLLSFQAGDVDLMPGDSLRVLMHEEVAYGYNMEVVHVSYSIREVIEVIKPRPVVQNGFKF